jgi:hypothetical protein
MRNHPFVLPQTVNSFYVYFNLNARVEDVAHALGYTHDVLRLDLPRTQEPLEWKKFCTNASNPICHLFG